MTGPVDESKNQLPDILCVIQVCIFDQPIFLLYFCMWPVSLAVMAWLGFSVLTEPVISNFLITWPLECVLIPVHLISSRCLLTISEIVDLFLIICPIMELQAFITVETVILILILSSARTIVSRDTSLYWFIMLEALGSLCLNIDV